MFIIEELLKEYKRISEKVLYEIMKDDLESAENSMRERQDILNKLSQLPINKDIDIEKEFGILTIDKRITEELQKSKLNVKGQIDEIKRQKAAQNVYGKQFEDIYFLNKQI